MNSLWIVIISVVTVYLAYNLYAKRIDRNVIRSDAKRATPARMYMDGVDFMPTSRNVLFGYHFKAIAAAGPIVGPITAANLWGWAPSLAWLILGVSFIGWVSDYSAIMVAVRNDGNSLSAIAYRLIAPRTRTILFIFIFFYLLLIAGAFVGILAAVLSARPERPVRHPDAGPDGRPRRPDDVPLADGHYRRHGPRRRHYAGRHGGGTDGTARGRAWHAGARPGGHCRGMGERQSGQHRWPPGPLRGAGPDDGGSEDSRPARGWHTPDHARI